MQTVKDFVIAIPHLCGAKNAARLARRNELVFEDELSKCDSVFARTALDAEDPYNRGDVLFGFLGDEEKIKQCRRLVRIAELSHYKSDHPELYSSEEFDALVVEAVCAEAENQDIAEVLTVDSAVSGSGW